jgi:hypothetical protein
MIPAEWIVSAAIRFRGRIYCGDAHKTAILVAANQLDLFPQVVWSEVRPEDQGFMSSDGNFYTRAEAHKLALIAGQLRTPSMRMDVTPELSSENVNYK